MPRFKDGVEFSGMHSRVLAALSHIDDATWTWANRDAIITSAREGTHSKGSLHYTGAALDVRTRDMNGSAKEGYAADLQVALGDDFDVVIEPTHIHVEYDPK